MCVMLAVALVENSFLFVQPITKISGTGSSTSWVQYALLYQEPPRFVPRARHMQRKKKRGTKGKVVYGVVTYTLYY